MPRLQVYWAEWSYDAPDPDDDGPTVVFKRFHHESFITVDNHFAATDRVKDMMEFKHGGETIKNLRIDIEHMGHDGSRGME